MLFRNACQEARAQFCGLEGVVQDQVPVWRDTLADSACSKNIDSGPGPERNDYADKEAAMTVRIPEMPGRFVFTFHGISAPGRI
jgi:hypothetical protein